MSKNSILTERLNEVKKQLRSNAKDIHFFDKLIEELLSLKGQLDVEPVFVCVNEKDIKDRIKGTTFEMAYTNKEAIYHLTGGLTVIADMNLGLGQQIMDYVINMKDTSPLPKDLKEKYEMDMLTTVYCLNAPLWAATDYTFRQKMGTLSFKYLNDKVEELSKKEPQEETPEQDREFFAAVNAFEQLEKNNE